MGRAALVGLGGLVGSIARYWLTGLVQQAANSDFPYGTLAVNLVGSLVVGTIMTLSLERGALSAEIRLLLTTGFCGGFTTMSTFSYETLALLRDGQIALALGNSGGTLIGCLAAVWLGQLLARLF